MENSKCLDKDESVRDEVTVDDKKQRPCGFLGLWKQFADDTTMHALGRAVNSAKIWKKVVWSILVVAAASVAARNLWLTFEDFATHPVSTTVSLEVKRSLPFPLITLCNLNPYPRMVLHQSLLDLVDQSVERGYSVSKQRDVFAAAVQKMKYEDINGIYNKSDDQFINFSEKLDNLTLECTFNKSPCVSTNNTRKVLPSRKYGNCWTYNIGGEWVSERSGYNNGFKLEFNIEQDEYLPFTPSAGLKVLIHHPNIPPFPEEDGIFVRPGVSTSIGLKQVHIKRQVKPWGSCVRAEDMINQDKNIFETGYSQLACQKTMYQNAIISQCQCCDENFPCPVDEENSTTEIYYCDESSEEDIACLKRIRKEYAEGETEGLESCYPDCDEITYENGYAVASWPSNNHIANLERKIKKRQKETKVTTEYLRNNLVRLSIYFESLTVKTIEALPKYNWNQLMSDIGGQLGLWMGFSIMTAIEFIELAWDFLLKVFGKICDVARRGKPRRTNC